ncbi:MAG: hypothetical protein ACR2OE_08035 [Thermomicrobiales bacterium]
MTITRRLSALEARMTPGRDTESERFGRYLAMSEGISYEELRAEAERIMRAHPGESIDQITAAMALEQGVSSAEIVARMESTIAAAHAWAAENTAT